MPKALLIIQNDIIRQRAIDWIKRVPIGWRVTIDEPKRSLEQNDYMWSLLTDIASQGRLRGRKLTTDTWKVTFMRALGHKMEFAEELDGSGVFPIGIRSSALSKKDMADLITFMIQWGDGCGIKFTCDKSPHSAVDYLSAG